MTSKTLMVLSVPAVAKLLPSRLTVLLLISPLCAWNSLTNSMPPLVFFQNFTTPSTEQVIRNSVNGVNVVEKSWSLCIKDLEYLGDVGRAATYSFSYGSLRRFFFGSAEGREGPKSSSEEESS